MCVVNEISLIVVLIKGHQHLRVRNLLDATHSMIKRVALSASLQTRVISLVCARQSKNNDPLHLPASEQNDRCLPLAGTSRIFPSQLLEFFFNSAGATFPPSVRPHPTSSLSCLFILAVRARAFRLKVARSVLVRTLPGIPRLKLSLFAMSPHHALKIPSLCPPPLRPVAMFSFSPPLCLFSQRLPEALNLPFVRARSREVNAPGEREGRRARTARKAGRVRTEEEEGGKG